MIHRRTAWLSVVGLLQACVLGPDDWNDPSEEIPDQPIRVEQRMDPNLTAVSGEAIGVSGLAALDPAKVPDLDTFGIWADVDADGALELLASSVERGHYEGWRSAEVWRADGDRMVPHPALGGLPRHLRAVVDLDDDGHVDLVIGEERQRISWGGPAGFTPPETLDLKPFPGMSPGGNPFSSIFVDDLDDDGRLDLILGFSCCQASCRDLHLLQQVSPRRFVDRTDWLEMGRPLNAYAVMAMRHPAGGRVAAIVGHAGCDSMGEESGSSFRWSSGPTPDFRVGRLSERLKDLSHRSPMGLVASSPLNDGRLFWNISLGESQAVIAGGAPGSFVLRQDFRMINPKGFRTVPWATVLADIDADGLPDWLTANADDTEIETLAERRDGQEQGLTLAYGTEPGRFGTPFVLTNPGHVGQYRTIAVEDIDGDGDPDFAVGSQTGGVEVLRTIGSTRSVSVKLAGTTSGSVAPNARLRAVPGGGRPEQHHLVVAPSQPMIFTPPVSFVGLGPLQELELLEVTWPTGVVQRLTRVAAGQRLTVTEPPAFRIDPPSRHLPADGAARFELVMMPRDASGGLRRDPMPEVGLDGPGTIEGTPVWQEDGWHLFVRAPGDPGEARVEMRFGELALQIRPRLVWE